MNSEIQVSIICITYNHENYIEDAIKGFLMQETSFSYEILIHDDASTDHTVQIIQKYVKQYPSLIRPIYQSENQYSKGINILSEYIYPQAKGKYIALCEGDDYWTDPQKLQKQYDAMEMHPEINLCATDAKILDEDSQEIIGQFMPLNTSGILTVRQTILKGGGSMATATLFGRKEMFLSPPPFRKIMDFDYTIQIHGSLDNGVLFLADTTTVYRKGVPASWTDRINHNLELKILQYKKIYQIMKQLDIDTRYQYRLSIFYIKLKSLLQILRFSILKIFRPLWRIK